MANKGTSTMTKVHFTQRHTKVRALRDTRLRHCLCMSVAAVAMFRCTQAHADGGAAVQSTSGAESRYRQTFDRNTDLSVLSFKRMPVTTDEIPAPLDSPRSLALATPEFSETRAYSDRDFRPRGHSIFDTTAALNVFDSPASMRSNPTVWQQLRDYRGHGRVRVLTLWDSTGGTVSLQAGKGGSPSLQWNSSWMTRGDAKRGLLDSLFAVSLAGAANTIRNVTHTGLPQGQSARDGAKLAAAAAGPSAR